MLELRAFKREFGQPVLGNLEPGPCLAHLAPKIGRLCHVETGLMGNDHQFVLIEGLTQLGDQGFLFSTVH